MESVNDFSNPFNISPQVVPINQHYLHFKPGMKVELMTTEPSGITPSMFNELYRDYAHSPHHNLVRRLLTIKEIRYGSALDGPKVLFNERPGFYLAKMFRLPGKMMVFPPDHTTKPAVERYRFQPGDKVKLVNAVNLPDGLHPEFMALRAILAKVGPSDRMENTVYAIADVRLNGCIRIAATPGWFSPDLFLLVSKAARSQPPQQQECDWSICKGDVLAIVPPQIDWTIQELELHVATIEAIKKLYSLEVHDVTKHGIEFKYQTAMYFPPKFFKIIDRPQPPRAMSAMDVIRRHDQQRHKQQRLQEELEFRDMEQRDREMKWQKAQGHLVNQVCPTGIALPRSNPWDMLNTMASTGLNPFSANHPGFGSGATGFSRASDNSGPDPLFQWPVLKKDCFKQGPLIEIKAAKRNIFKPIIL